MRNRFLLIALTSFLAALSGCKGKTVTYLLIGGDSFASAEPGQTLVWDLVPPYGSVTFFEVAFIGPDPCGTHPPLRGTPGHPASCTVTAQPPAGGKFVRYQYKFKLEKPDPKVASSSDMPWQVFPCNNCTGYVGSPGSNGPQTQPIAHTEQLVFPHDPSVTFPGTVNLSCDDHGNVIADPADPSVLQGSFVQWYLDPSLNWQITFDPPVAPHPTACVEGNSLSSSDANNSFCTVNTYQTTDPIIYPYGVKITDNNGNLKCSTPAPTPGTPSPFALTMMATPTP